MVFSELSCEELARRYKGSACKEDSHLCQSSAARKKQVTWNCREGNAVRWSLETVVRLAAREVSKPRGWGDIFP